MKTNANLYIFYFSVPQQKEVAGVWYRDPEGKQFLKIALPADAWSMAATIKTRKGVHRMTMERWEDSTHKMSAYNNRYHPSNRDQRQIDRMGERQWYCIQLYNPIWYCCKVFIRLVACVGSGDPVRVLRLYTTITLDEVCSIYC